MCATLVRDPSMASSPPKLQPIQADSDSTRQHRYLALALARSCLADIRESGNPKRTMLCYTSTELHVTHS